MATTWSNNIKQCYDTKHTHKWASTGTHIHVASLAIVCSDAIPQAIYDYLV